MKPGALPGLKPFSMLPKQCLFILLLLGCSLLTRGQVNIQAQLPGGGPLHQDQLWSLLLTNGRNEPQDVTLKLTLKDEETGDVVLSAATGWKSLRAGATMIAARDLQPIVYTYQTGECVNGLLPPGRYIACYQVVRRQSDASVPVGEECVRVGVEPISPPQLTYPENGAVLSSPYPQFTWLGPAPILRSQDLHYTILVCEVIPGQTPAEALQNNMPLLTRTGLSRPLEAYPSSAPKLDTGKVYAWQVLADSKGRGLAKTEIWTFEIQQNTGPVTEVDPGSFVTLRSDLTGTYGLKEPVVHIKYVSATSHYDTMLLILDEQGKPVAKAKRKISAGDNYIDVTLSRAIKKGMRYRVQLDDGNGHSSTLRFILH